MVDYLKINQARAVYNDTPAPNSFFVPEDVGTGSVFTYRAYGEVAQSVEIRGGFPDDVWEDMEWICTLTVGGTQSAVVQHTWPVVAVAGSATLKIARGNA